MCTRLPYVTEDCAEYKLPHVFSICPSKVKILLLQYCELKVKYVVEAFTAVLNGI
jgi:hypothetical protein